MKKLSKVLLIWLGIELAALPFAIPAMAKLTATLTAPPIANVQAIPLPSGEGELVFLIASNTRFAVISENTAAPLTLSLTRSGNEQGVNFGKSAQYSGAASTCSAPINANAARIFTGLATSTSKRGSVQNRAIRLVVRYESDIAPKISVISMDAASEQAIPLAFPCGKFARLACRNQS